jgi:nitroreductase
MDSSEFFGFVTHRSSVRDFSAEPLADDDIPYMLDCASTAPSAGNLEAWDVIVTSDEEIRIALAEAAYDQEHIARASTVFVTCANYVRSMSRYGERGILYAVQDATIACTYLMLAAHARQIQTCWTGAFDEEAVREILGLPQHVRPLAMLAAGHGRPPPALTERMAISEHVHYERW